MFEGSNMLMTLEYDLREYPLVIHYIAIDNCHRHRKFSQNIRAIFHIYVNVYQREYVYVCIIFEYLDVHSSVGCGTLGRFHDHMLFLFGVSLR